MGLQLHILDLIIIIVFILFTVAFGLWYSRRAGTNKEEFFLAGRSLTWPLIGASLFATNISTQQFVGQGGLAYSIGIGACFFQLMGAVALLMLGLVFLPKYLAMRIFTLPQFMEERFSPGIRVLLSGYCIVTISVSGLSGVLYSGGIILQQIFGIQSQSSLYMFVLFLAVAAALYTLVGGLKSVVITDFIQNGVLILGGVVTLVLSLYYISKMPGGLEGIFNLKEITADGAVYSKWSLFRPLNHSVIPWFGVIVGGLLTAVNGHCMNQDYIQRGLGAKNLYHGAMGSIFSCFLKLLAVFIIGVPGVLAAYIFKGENILPDQAYMALIVKVLPVGFTGLVMAALIASIMSTIDSVLAACSSLFTVDFYLRKHKHADEKTYVRIGRYSMFAVMLIGILCVPIISSFSHMYLYFQQFISYTAPTACTVYLAGLFFKRANRTGALATLILGGTTGFFMFFITSVEKLALNTFGHVEIIKNILLAVYNLFPEWLTGINFLYGCFLHFVFCVCVMLIFSYLTEAPSEEKLIAMKQKYSLKNENEPAYASRNVKIMTVVFVVCLLVVFIVFS